MSYPHTSPRVRLSLRVLLALVLAATLELAWLDVAAAQEPKPTATPTLEPTATPTLEPTATPTLEPTATRTPKPTATPTSTPTPLPAQDLAVSFFNNFCEAGQPLLVTIFNTSATPLEGQTLRLRLFDESGLLEEHDHLLSLAPYGTTNLPLLNSATPPWVRIEIQLMTGAPDPNLNNDSASCGVAVDATQEPTESAGPGDQSISPGTSSRAAPPPASGVGSGFVWRQAVPTETPTQPAVQPTLEPLTAPSSARAVANGPQPSLTPIGDAGGGLAPEAQDAFPSRTLLMTGVVLLAAGTSWAFYYLTRPPRNA